MQKPNFKHFIYFILDFVSDHQQLSNYFIFNENHTVGAAKCDNFGTELN